MSAERCEEWERRADGNTGYCRTLGRTTLSGGGLINEFDFEVFEVKVVRLSYTSKEMTMDVLTHQA